MDTLVYIKTLIDSVESKQRELETIKLDLVKQFEKEIKSRSTSKEVKSDKV